MHNNPKTNEIENETVELTYGEKLVGLTFNPSSDERVEKIKRSCAEMIDDIRLCHSLYIAEYEIKKQKSETSVQLSRCVREFERREKVCDDAISSILATQMLAVKALFVD